MGGWRSIPPTLRSRHSAMASGRTGSPWPSTVCTTRSRTRRCSSPSTASAPTTTHNEWPTSSAVSRSSTKRSNEGIDIRGFFHWTAVDNYEWLHGYDVSFGIVDRDRNVKPSAMVLRREALGT